MEKIIYDDNELKIGECEHTWTITRPIVDILMIGDAVKVFRHNIDNEPLPWWLEVFITNEENHG